MPSTECIAVDPPETDPVKAILETRSHDSPIPSRARLRAGRPARRIERSRLNSAPPPNLIRFFRRRAGLSLQDLGKLVGVTRETIRRIEERDTWLDAERATEIGRALSLPKEAIGFSTAPDAYTWAAKSLSVVGYVAANDEIKDSDLSSRRLAGSSHLPDDSVALDIQQGKMRGWLLVYRPESSEPMTKDVLERQGSDEKFIACLEDGTTWWRHITPAARSNLYHLNSRYQDPINDVRIAWVAKIVAIENGLVELPTHEELSKVVGE
ncbi:helix-turn-helix transcriptional regulator [Bradyrhizobium commune]|uniref:Helix-turn-helix transcriptional regulator n=1 Tax=Bradyrhizobium commune TaxID=83627 RepID=A0A7S9GWB1_9BRAD|nr:helix-turn-helix transcriptional regulator [Bradyrhizobium commune]QPF88620.1 helix-turn-helix transcriptional regulator [Bradyrhizobium commune]